jgi:hypothetical protein
MTLTPDEIAAAEEHRKWYFETIRLRRRNGFKFMVIGGLILVVFLLILMFTGKYFVWIIPVSLFTSFFGLLQAILPGYIPYNLSDSDIH